MATFTTSDNNYGTAKLIVDATAGQGNYTTIAAALAAATSGQTIFIRPGTYTENLTLVPGVNLTAFTCDSKTPNVTIIGNCTLSTAGTVSISNVRLQTNSAALLTISGSVVSILNVINCDLNCTNNTGISLSSSGLSFLNLIGCSGNLETTGIAYFSQSSNTSMNIEGGVFTNTGASTTANTVTGNANFTFRNTDFQSVLSATTNTSSFILKNSLINIRSATLGSVVSATGISLSGSSGNIYAVNSYIGGGTSPAASIGSGTTGTFYDCIINSSNTNCITGAGSILYSNLAFSGPSSTIDTTTKTVAGTIQGSKNTAPTIGFLGEQIRSALAQGSAISLSTGTAANVTSISLTAGIWDVSGIIGFGGGAITGTQCNASISATSATIGANSGDDQVFIPTVPTASSNVALSIPSLRITLTSTTTYYLVARGTFTVGAMTAWGRISATRVG